MKKTVVLFFVALLVFAGCAPKAVRLENRYISGEILRYRMEASGKGAMTLSGLPEEKEATSRDMDIHLEMDSSQKVLAVDEEGTAELEFSYDRLIEKITSAGQTMEIIADKNATIMRQNGKVIYDSTAPEAQERPSPLKGLIGQSMSMKVTKSGKILEAKGLEGLKKLMPQLDIQGMIKQSQPAFPEKKVRIGESWTQDVELPLPQVGKPVTIETKYTLKGFEKVKGYNCARIEAKVDTLLTDLVFDMSLGKPQTEVGMVIDRLSQKTEGMLYFAHKEGKLVKSDQDVDMSMEMTTKMKREGKEMEIKTKMDMKMKVVMELQ